jgi:hypothetical protein
LKIFYTGTFPNPLLENHNFPKDYSWLKVLTALLSLPSSSVWQKLILPGYGGVWGGRFGNYGDLKRRRALQRGRKEAAKLAKGLAMKRQNRQSIIPSTHTSIHPVDQKTHKTAVVVIPPDNLRAPCDALYIRTLQIACPCEKAVM